MEFIKWVCLANYAIQVSGHKCVERKQSAFKYQPPFIHALAFHRLQTFWHGGRAKKPNCSELETDTRTKKKRKTILFGSLNVGLKWVRTECLERNHCYIIIHIWLWKTGQSSWRKQHPDWRRSDEPQPEFVYGNKCTYTGSHEFDNWEPQWAFTQCELQMCISRVCISLQVMVTPIRKTYR